MRLNNFDNFYSLLKQRLDFKIIGIGYIFWDNLDTSQKVVLQLYSTIDMPK